MKYNIIATVQIEAADETALKNEIEAINTYVENKDGTIELIIRTAE